MEQVVIEETFPVHPTPTWCPLATLTDVDRVLSWRILQLVHAGYGDEDSVLLACAEDVDLHEALDLRQHGCPAATAVRILL
jgi:hypothetical protein